MIQHHIGVAQLYCCNYGGALIQTGHRNIWVSIRANHTVPKVQFILITRHSDLWRNTTQMQISLWAGICVQGKTVKIAQQLHSTGHSEWHQWLNDNQTKTCEFDKKNNLKK